MKQASTVKRKTVKPRASKNRLETPSAKTSYRKDDYIQKVQELAYHFYMARGCVHGYDVEDWLAAEEIVKGS